MNIKHNLNNLEKLGFDNWFKDKVDLSKTNDFKIARVISVNPQTPSTRRAKTAKGVDGCLVAITSISKPYG